MPKIQTLTQKVSKTIKHLKMTFWTKHGISIQCVLQWIQLGLYSTFFQYILQLQNEGLSKKAAAKMIGFRDIRAEQNCFDTLGHFGY